MILERLDGKGPNRHVMKSDFNDIHYMEEFLFCLFNALDIGQKAIGFHHSGVKCTPHQAPCHIFPGEPLDSEQHKAFCLALEMN